MSTAMTMPEIEIVDSPKPHFRQIGMTLWECRQPHCDGVHHYFVSCHEH